MPTLGASGRSFTVAVLIAATALVSLSPERARAQPYEVTWYTVDGGGVMNATGGDYKASGTIGQADTGTLTGGDFKVTGGFWAIGPGSACAAPDPPQADPYVTDLGYGTRNRYLAFSGGMAGEPVAVRVKFDIGNGEETMWVGPPHIVCELSGEPGECPGDEPEFQAAPLQCDLFAADWSLFGVVHVYGESIFPGHSYDVQLVGEGCDGNEAAYSEPLTIHTAAFGDVVGVYDDSGDCPVTVWGYEDCWTSPDATGRNFDDISATVDKFKNAPGAPAKSRTDVCPCRLDRKVDFSDIPCVVDGFRGLPIPCELPDPCP